MTDPDVAAIAGELSEAQRRYIRAVAEYGEPYEPRHGRTANWALRHKITETVVRLGNGSEGPMNGFFVRDICHRDTRFVGQRLTPLGQRVRDHIIRSERDA